MVPITQMEDVMKKIADLIDELDKIPGCRSLAPVPFARILDRLEREGKVKISGPYYVIKPNGEYDDDAINNMLGEVK